MRRNNDKMLLESLVRKYGVMGIKNAIRRINESIDSDFEIKDGVLVRYHGDGGKVIIPDGVTKIGYHAFGYCESLTSVTIPDSVTKIWREAFNGCTSLRNVTIGDGVTSIGDFAFSRCTSLTSVNIPNSVTSIERAAFCFCTSLRNVTIGNGVTSIEPITFYNCTSLTSVTIGNSVTEIGQEAFNGCTSLANINIPNGVKIGKDAFKDTKIKIKNELSDEFDDIVSAAINVFSNWENDGDGWDTPFNAYKELSNNDFTDILDYYQGWDDFYNYLDMDEDEFNALYDKMSSRDLKRINKEIKDAF